MGMGRRRREVQQKLWVATASLPDVPRHVFYEKLNRLLAQSDFDTFVEELCEPYYAVNVGRDSISPGRYFRMLFVGYFEGIDSQRGDEIDRPQGDRRRLEGVREASGRGRGCRDQQR